MQDKMPTLRNVSVLSCVFAAAVFIEADAQSRVVVSVSPKAGQVVHGTTTATAEVFLVGATTPHKSSTASLTYTQTNSKVDDRGRTEAAIAIEQLETEETTNGIAQAFRADHTVLGRTVIAVLDGTGRLVETRVPPELKSASNALRQTIVAAYTSLNFLPASPLAIGETANVPLKVPVTVPGGARTPLEVRALVTLRSVETRAGSRVARIEEQVESATVSGQWKVSGGGVIEMNLDHGFVSASTIELTMTGDLQTPGAGGRSRPVPVRMVAKITSTGRE